MNQIINDGELKELDIKLLNTSDLKYPPCLRGIKTRIRENVTSEELLATIQKHSDNSRRQFEELPLELQEKIINGRIKNGK